jgi:hypothetical protein
MSEFILRLSCLIWNSMTQRTAGDVQDNDLMTPGGVYAVL